MSSLEFARWMAYDRHDPIGGFRGDIQAAIIARTIAAAVAGENAPRTSEFLPTFWSPEEEEEEEEEEEGALTVLGMKINKALSVLGASRPKSSSVLVPKKPPTKEA